MLRLSLLSALVFICLVPIQSRAQSLISIDDPIYGEDSITRDLNTGLEWLDLSITTTLSYNDLVVLTDPGGLLADFHIATLEEVNQLYNSAGIMPGMHPQSEFETIISFIDLIGQTSDVNGFPAAFGITDSPRVSNGLHSISRLQVGLFNGEPFYLVGEGGMHNDAIASQFRGGWLARPVTVPEPGIAMLYFSLGTIAIAWRRTRFLTD